MNFFAYKLIPFVYLAHFVSVNNKIPLHGKFRETVSSNQVPVYHFISPLRLSPSTSAAV